MNIIISFLAFIAGGLVVSGSGLFPPFEWISTLGVPANKHMYIGLILFLVSIVMHIAVGGRIWPTRR